MALSCVVAEIFDAQKYRDLEIPVKGQLRSSKVVLLGFSSNFVHMTHRFWDIRLQKCRDLENRVRGPSRSLKMSTFARTHLTSYWRSIVTLALSRVVSEIFNVEKYRDLEVPVKGQSRSLNVVPLDRLSMVFWNAPFWDILLQKYRDLENRVRGPSRSLKMSPLVFLKFPVTIVAGKLPVR